MSASLCALLLTAVVGAGNPADPPPRSYWVYVAAESADQVHLVRFDGRRAVVEDVISVGTLPTEIEGPHGLTVGPDGDYWYLSLAHGKPWGTLSKYTTGTNELMGQVELGLFPATMQISTATGLLYCVNFDLHGDMTPSSVSIVDPDEMVEVARTVTGSMPHGSRLSRDGLRHYSCAMMSGLVYEMDALSFGIRRTFDFEADVTTGRAIEGANLVPVVHPDHASDGEASSAGAKGREAQEATPPQGDTTGDTSETEAKKNDDEHHAITKPTWVEPHPTEPKVYVALNGFNQVVELDLETWQPTRRFLTDQGPYNLALTADGKTMVVTYKTAGACGVWDLEAEKETAHIASSRRVTHGVVLSPDNRYAFVSSEGVGGEAGTLDIYDLARNRKVCLVELGLQAGGIAFWKMD